MRVQSLGREDPLEEGTAPHSSILAWRMPWTGEPGRLQSTGSQRAGHDWATDTFRLVLAQPSGAGTVISARCARENRALIEKVPTPSHGSRAHRSTRAQGPLCPQPCWTGALPLPSWPGQTGVAPGRRRWEWQGPDPLPAADPSERCHVPPRRSVSTLRPQTLSDQHSLFTEKVGGIAWRRESGFLEE